MSETKRLARCDGIICRSAGVARGRSPAEQGLESTHTHARLNRLNNRSRPGRKTKRTVERNKKKGDRERVINSGKETHTHTLYRSIFRSRADGDEETTANKKPRTII